MLSRTPETLVVGTRGSLLARAQTQWFVDQLRSVHSNLEIETRIITTTGDRDQTRPLPEIGAKGLFTVELEQALLAGEIDVAVHSGKDLQSVLAPGLEILCYPVREDPRDAWVAKGGVAFANVPTGSVVGTSSLRRQAQLRMVRPDLQYAALRGNIDTRIRKVHEGQCVGAVLAMAGLNRAHLSEHVTHGFEPDTCLPAPAQGALAIEGRTDDARVRDLLAAVNHETTALAVRCERAILGELDAGCRAPVAIYARCEGDRLICDALVADPSGAKWVRSHADRPIGAWKVVEKTVIDELKAGGAEAIIAACRA
jgi:hydroxymethylbilane synthase